MGTNFYRIPKEEDIKARQERLLERVQKLDLSVSNISNSFADITDDKSKYDWDRINCWLEFTGDLEIHIGKNSMGWKFLFNHNDWKYYKNMEELKEFINSGRLVNEYGEEQNIEEFWELVENKQKNSEMINGKQYYEEGHGGEDAWNKENARKNNYHEKIKWGYRFSQSTDFS